MRRSGGRLPAAPALRAARPPALAAPGARRSGIPSSRRRETAGVGAHAAASASDFRLPPSVR